MKIKVEQMKHESETWLRTLEFLQAENTNLKNRMVFVANIELPPELLSSIEQFQNQFLEQDHLVSLLRSDVLNQMNLLKREIFDNGILIRTILHNQCRIRKEMVSIETSFTRMKSDFNHYLTEMIE